MKRLTEIGRDAGSECKIAPGQLAQVVRRLTPSDDTNLIVGTRTGDDAAVYRLDAERALVVSVDLISPVVDDARVWGRIAANHSVSDIYAMGARPILALNVLGWSTEELSIELLSEVVLGGEDAAREGGFAVVGGHTIDDPEPKYGMAVVGEVHPDRLLTNAGLRETDVLLITKQLGTGVVAEAVRTQTVDRETADEARSSMLRLNDKAAAVALSAGTRGCTDIGGFGLLGHLGRMALESGVDIELEVGKIPLFSGVRELAESGVITNAAHQNHRWVRSQLDAGSTPELDQLILSDPQTSGGLMFGVDPADVNDAIAELAAAGYSAAIIGRATSGAGTLRLR